MPIPMGSVAIAADLEAKIAAGTYPPGSKLPSYSQLRVIYAPTSMSTLERAVKMLEDRGIVIGVRGSGLYVAEDAGPKG